MDVVILVPSKFYYSVSVCDQFLMFNTSFIRYQFLSSVLHLQPRRSTLDIFEVPRSANFRGGREGGSKGSNQRFWGSSAPLSLPSLDSKRLSKMSFEHHQYGRPFK